MRLKTISCDIWSVTDFLQNC